MNPLPSPSQDLDLVADPSSALKNRPCGNGTQLHLTDLPLVWTWVRMRVAEEDL